MRGQVALREPAVERWHSDEIVGRGRQAVNGTVLFDATSAAVVTTSVGAASSNQPVRQLVVFGLREPTVQHRFTLAGADAVRFARGRGHAIALIERRRLVLLDLRFGAVLVEHTHDGDISDLAIDDSGQTIALRRGEGLDDVVVLSVRDLVAAGTRSARVPVEDISPTERPSEATAVAANERFGRSDRGNGALASAARSRRTHVER